MVNKDGGILVASLGETALGLAKEARLCWLEVVDGDAPPRLGGGEDRMLGFLLFVTPSNLRHGPKKTTCAPEGPDLGKLLENLSIKGKEAELLEGGMTEAVVPSHELGLVIRRRERVLLVLLKQRRWIEGEGRAAKDTGMLRSCR
jgi:hypothetical protein